MALPDPTPAMLTLAWFGEIGRLVETTVVVITGYIAIRGLNSWRREMIGKRKAEIAEQVLTAFYEAKDSLAMARTSGALGSEGQTRKTDEGESDQVRMMRNVYFIPIERLNRDRELFSRLHAQRYTFRAYFGDAGELPFKAIFAAHGNIMNVASILIQQAQFDGAQGGVASARESLLNDLGWGRRARPDDMDRSIEAAVAAMESVCRNILEGRG